MHPIKLLYWTGHIFLDRNEQDFMTLDDCKDFIMEEKIKDYRIYRLIDTQRP